MDFNITGRHTIVLSFLILHIILLLSLKIKCQDIAKDFIDLKQPIVILDKQQEKDNYFSYSIAAFKSVSQNGVVQSKLYLGSPKSNYSTTSGARSFESGVVMECGLKLGESSEIIQCKPLALSESGAPANSYGGSECCVHSNSYNYCDKIKEFPNEAWVGGTISTSSVTGNQLVTCGHRWQTEDSHVLTSKKWRVSGMCYRLRVSDVQFPEGNRLIPEILTPPLRAWNQLHKANPRSTFSEHLWFYGQFGFSSAFDNVGRLLVGAPGYYNWNGGVVSYSNARSSRDSRNGQCPPTNTVNIWPDFNQLRNFKDAAHYLGYAMTSGKYWSGESVFAVGAPRATMTETNTYLIGEVKFFTLRSNGLPEPQNSIFGNQLGSYFGSVLATANINGNGLQELIVGAPYHNLHETNVDSYDEGCAFVYSFALNNNFLYIADIDQLCPSTVPGGRFGSAIANLGDINQDSYDDIAISAPMADNGVGKVYIYLGTSKKLSQNPNNPLSFSASEFKTAVKGFGSYLYGNVDLDGNGTPDLIIGSFVSKQAFIFRTRPKLEIYLTFPNNIQKFKRENKNFNINYCIKIKRTPKQEFTRSLKIHVEVTADADRSDNSVRFQFAENNQRSLQFSVDVTNKCNFPPIPVTLSKDLLPTDSKEIKFKWQLHYNETTNLPVNAGIFEIFNTQGRESPIQGSRSFCPSCPAPTTSEEIFLSIPLANDTCDSDNNPVCNSKLKVYSQFTNKNGAVGPSNSILGSTEQKVLKILVENTGETAYSPTINLTMHFPSRDIAEHVIKTLVTTDCSQSVSEAQEALESLEYKTTCRSSIPLHTDKNWVVSYRMHFGGLNAISKDEEISFQIAAYPGTYVDQAKTHDFKMNLVSEFDLKISGIKQENVLDFNSRDSLPFVNSYLLRNEGVSPLSSISLEFMIPVKRNLDGKYETVIQIAEPKLQGLTCNTTETFQSFAEPLLPLDKPSINGSADFISPVHMSRKRRDAVKGKEESKTNEVVKSSSSPLKSISVDKEIGCVSTSSDWKCALVTCQVTYPLTKNNPVTIGLRLKIVNRFARKLFGENTERIVVKTDAKAKVFESEKFTKMASSQTEFSIIKDKGLPALVIFGSAIGGLILFLLITFGLFKCGFFRRKTKEELQAMKAREEERKILAENFPMPSEDDE